MKSGVFLAMLAEAALTFTSVFGHKTSHNLFSLNLAQFRWKTTAVRFEAANLSFDLNSHVSERPNLLLGSTTFLRAPNTSSPRRCFFHARTCPPQAFPGHTQALESSHACFPTPTPSSSPTANTLAPPEPPALPPFRTQRLGAPTARSLTRRAPEPRRRGWGGRGGASERGRKGSGKA